MICLRLPSTSQIGCGSLLEMAHRCFIPNKYRFIPEYSIEKNVEILLCNIKNYIKKYTYKIWKNRPILGNNKSIVAIYIQCGIGDTLNIF